MYLKFGDYSHSIGEADVSMRQVRQYSDRGQMVGILHTWTIKGVLQAASQSALSTAITALEAAYSSRRRVGIGLYFDDGTASAHNLTAARSLSGVKVTNGPDYPTGSGGEYSTYRSYEIVVESLQPPTDESGDPLPPEQNPANTPGANGVPVLLMEWEETLSFSGGGPRYVFLELLEGDPVRQIVAQRTPYRARQSGSALAFQDYAAFPEPFSPDNELQTERERTQISPKRVEAQNGQPAYQEYRCSWSYSFQSTQPMSGSPSIR